MKVLQLGKHYPPFVGGTEKVIQVLTETLNKHGIPTDVLCVNEKRGYQELYFEGYKVYQTSLWFRVASTSISPGMIFKLRELKNYYDIIHVHMPDPMANLSVFLTRPKAKILVQWHMDIVKQKILFKFYKPLVEWLFKKARVILLSSASLKEGSQFKEFFKEKGIVLPLPFDTEEFSKLEKDLAFESYLYSLSKGRKVILSVGRLVYYKGFDVLIKAGKFLPEDTVVFIVGEGPLRARLENLIRDLNLQEKIFLLGRLSRSQLASCYEVCEVFCLPSLYRTEAFGIVQIESMSFGKPVVSTCLPASGICEVNLDGETGLCVPPGDEWALAGALKEILYNKDLYKKLSHGALRRVKDFEKEKIVRRLIEIYHFMLIENYNKNFKIYI